MGGTWYPKAVRLPITTKEYSITRDVPLVSICDHITDGTDSRNHLQNVANQSSVHFLIREENGQGVVYQFMPVEWMAWGNGRYSNNNPYMPQWVKDLIAREININDATVSIEHERKWPFTTTLPEPMLSASIALHKWLGETFPTIKRDREHVIGHYQIDHVSRAHCPGGTGGKLFPFDTIIAAMNAPAPAPIPPPPAFVTFPETGVSVQADFYDYWVSHGGLEIFGYPVKAEAPITINGLTLQAQSFERARFERQANGSITLGLVEVERLKAIGQL